MVDSRAHTLEGDFCGGLPEGVLCILFPGQESNRSVLVVMAGGLEEVADLPFSLPVAL